jgi:hypothetical protein
MLTQSVEVHPSLSNNGHPVDGALVGASSQWPVMQALYKGAKNSQSSPSKVLILDFKTGILHTFSPLLLSLS